MDRVLYLFLAFLGYSSWRLILWSWPLCVFTYNSLSVPKYHANNKLIDTTTDAYSVSPQLMETTCAGDCDLLANVSLPIVFGYSDPESVLKNTVQLSCLPTIFGYSEAEGLEVFPWVGYPRCEDINPEPQIISLDFDRNELRMDCGEKGKGKFVTGPMDERKLVLRHEVESQWTVETYPDRAVPIPESHEFAFGTCDNSPYMKQAVYAPRFNSTLLRVTKDRIESLREQHKYTAEPLTVLVMVIDSFSRKHFFRKLPKTAEWLNSLKRNNQYHVADFYIHNIVGTNSVGNQAPLLGKNIHEKYVGDLNVDFAGKDALWNIYREMGFVTLFGLESCDNSFPRKLGRMPNIDYVSSPFFCAAYKLTTYKASKSNKMQRCIGRYMSHTYLFNYTNAFAEMYKDVNQWIYVHVDAAHEATGQHAETLDFDLQYFLSEFLSSHRNTVIFLEGDHGMRYGDWMKSIPAFQENRLPPLFLITPKRLLDRIPGGKATVEHNSLRLNSKYDMRKTMIFLSGIPYGLTVDSTELYPAVNMYTEKVADNRTCLEAGIPPWHCSCLVLQPMDAAVLTPATPFPELTSLLMTLADLALSYFNSIVYSTVSLSRGSLCRKLSLRAVEAAFGLQLDSVLEELKLELSVNELSTARFEVLFIVSSGKAYMRKSDQGYPSVPILYNGFRKSARMLSFSRLDKYGGICEQQARALDLEAELCICQSHSS